MPGTVIDSLVVTLGLDPTKFTQGQKAALEAFSRTKTDAVSTAKEMEARGAQAAQFFGSIKKEALGLFATLIGVGGLEQFTTKTVSSMTALGRQAKLMGVAASDLQAFKMMIDRTGASGDAAASSLTSLAEAMETYRTRGQISASLLTGLNQIGAGPDDSAIQVYAKFAAWAKGRDARFVNQEGQLLGFDPGSIANATKGGENFRNQMAESYRLGVPKDGDIAKVSELMGAFQRLRQAITGDANALLYGAAPALSGALNLTDRLVGANKTLTQTIIAIGAAMSAWFALKAPVWALRLLGISGPSAGVKAVEGAAARVGGRALGAAARVAGPLGLAYDILAPDALNVGEDAQMARFRARMGKGGVKGAGGASSEGNGSVADRNNNPGNIMGGGRYLHFATLDEGYAAMARQILIDYTKHGQHTVRDLIDGKHGWSRHDAPGNTAAGTANYIAYVSRALGISPDANLDVKNPLFLSHLMSAMHRFEAGPGSGKGTTVHIDKIEVRTAATDARGVAAGIGSALKSNLTSQSNVGLGG